jgi:hypothetical protein
MHLKNKKNNKYSIEFMLLTIYLCCSNEIGDKYHYVMSCGALKEERKKLLPHFQYDDVSIYIDSFIHYTVILHLNDHPLYVRGRKESLCQAFLSYLAASAN